MELSAKTYITAGFHSHINWANPFDTTVLEMQEGDLDKRERSSPAESHTFTVNCEEVLHPAGKSMLPRQYDTMLLSKVAIEGSYDRENSSTDIFLLACLIPTVERMRAIQECIARQASEVHIQMLSVCGLL